MGEDTPGTPPTPAEWYHELELPTGRTSGLFDLDGVRTAVPWPDLTGRRCLDVATFDGYWAFEMERRGAAEVVAVDVGRSRDFDWLPRRREDAHDVVTGDGFRHAAHQLGSRVDRRTCNVYELTPEELGTFDVVVLGALLLHLAAPFAALERIRQVCRGTFISIEQVDARLSTLSPRRPAMALPGDRFPWVWAVPNLAGHARMLTQAGFDVGYQSTTVLAFGDRVPPDERTVSLGDRLARRLRGVPPVAGLWGSIVVAEPSPAVAEHDDLPIARRRLS